MRECFHVDAATVLKVLKPAIAIEALRDFHADRRTLVTGRELLQEGGESQNTFVGLMAWQRDEFIVVKLIASFPRNTSLNPPRPSGQGLVALFDGSTGEPLMTCDAAALTFAKTAADSALGASFLSRWDSSTLLIIGAGGLGPHFINAHRTVRPEIKRVLIWNRSLDRATRLISEMLEAGVQCELAPDLPAALGQADIVSALTMSEAPLVLGRLLKPGAHVDLVGSYQHHMREADDDVMRRSQRVFVDTRDRCEENGDISGPLTSGVISRSSIAADLFDLCSGAHRGRENEREITVFKNVGGAHLDLAVAKALFHQLSENRSNQDESRPTGRSVHAA